MRNSRFFNIVQKSDLAANDSDKSFTVPASKAWLVRSIYVKLVTTATVGNRQVDLLITDGSDNLLAKYQAGAVQALSLTREYVFAPDHPQESAFTGGVMLRAIAYGIVIPAGYKVRVFDSAVIDVAADDMDVRMLVEEMEE